MSDQGCAAQLGEGGGGRSREEGEADGRVRRCLRVVAVKLSGSEICLLLLVPVLLLLARRLSRTEENGEICGKFLPPFTSPRSISTGHLYQII